MTQFSEFFRTLPQDPVSRGRAFERVCCWLLRNHPLYRSQLEHVWLWRDWPDAWGRDSGIDIVAETRDGQLWAVQCKAVGQQHAIAKREIDSFLAESARGVFAQRLLIATTDAIGPNALQAIHGQQISVALLRRTDLEIAPVVWPRSFDDLASGGVAPRRCPDPHAARAIDEVVSGFGRLRRGQLIMPCGTGKTLIGLWVSERLRPNRVLIAVPSLALAAQTLSEWAAQSHGSASYLAVCSDQTVASEDHLIAFTSDLGLPVTTDPEEIANFLERTPGRQVVVTTYQSASRVAAALQQPRRADMHFDLLIADEAHRCAGPMAGDFALVLSDTAIPCTRRLFMTATPRFYTGRVRKEAAETGFEVASMDQSELFGEPLHRLSFAAAISQQLLTDYVVAVVAVTDRHVEQLVANRSFVTLQGSVTDAESLASQVALLKGIRSYGSRRTISFHSRVARATRFSRDLLETHQHLPRTERPAGDLGARHVNGKMSAAQRRAAMQWLGETRADQSRVVTNARCLGEGVNLPTLDCVAFVDPKASQVDVIQAVGRALRRSPDKKRAVIIVPVVIRDGEVAEQALRGSAWSTVWAVLRALRAHDETLAEELDSIRHSVGRRGNPFRVPPRIHLDLPETVGAEFIDALHVRLVEQTTDTWIFMLGLLERFVEREGHARVLHRHVEQGKQLGSWVLTQRAQYKTGALSAERVARLQALPGWTWNAQADWWERGYARLLDYVASGGSADVPGRAEHDGFGLGNWVSRQRQAHGKGRLSAELVQLLEEVPGWKWVSVRDDTELGLAFAALEAFIKREGHSHVPRDHLEGGFPLGPWVRRRRMYKHRLDRETKQRLEAMPGWEWFVVPSRAWEPVSEGGPNWDRNFALLREYAREHGTPLVPRKVVYDDVKLGNWVATLQSLYRQGRLREECVEALEAMPGWLWNPFRDRWESGFAALSSHAAETGSAFVDRDYVTADGFELGHWAYKQRRNFHRLSVDRAARLASLPGWRWWIVPPKTEAGND